MNNINNMNNISPIDGRYAKYTIVLNNLFSEFAYIKQRVLIEIKYFLLLLNLNTDTFPYNEGLNNYMIDISNNISDEDIYEIRRIENKINHDVKSIEYYLSDLLSEKGYNNYINLLHFGLTSQDINTIAYSISLAEFNNLIFIPKFDNLLNSINERMNNWKDIVIIGRTHGQSASWTSLGKEFNVFHYKLTNDFNLLKEYKFSTKISGAVGNMTSHKLFADTNWNLILNNFVEELGLTRTEITTQIHNYNEYSQCFDILKRLCSILIDMCTDIWLYCSYGELILIKPKEHVGSSIMPHKVNPIEFENAEGNLKIAEMWLQFISSELCKSRLQRDLTDSTILRNLGVIFGHILISIDNLSKGFTYLQPDMEKIEEILFNNITSMSEVDQHLLRIENNVNGYNTIKNKKRKMNNNVEINEKVNYYKKLILNK